MSDYEWNFFVVILFTLFKNSNKNIIEKNCHQINLTGVNRLKKINRIK